MRELHALRPDRVKVIPGPDGWPEAFEYAAGGAKVRIAGEPAPGVRAVLHMKLFHPANDHYGLSPIEAAAAAIDLHNAAARWNKALLDNSARPSGALVYSNGQQMTAEQFERLKSELEASFQGTRNAGRPLLLEGGLDWKAMSLTPRDLDFMEAKHAAAREIALAIGVPPMLLGIPGDNTYANYAEANRAFWRQTVLPLVQRTARALTLWLTPAYGTDLRFSPDLDAVEALAPEREALWARMERTSFLSDAEKRAAVGYGDKPEGGDSANRPFTNKYNPYHDDRGRFTFAPDGQQVVQNAPRGGSGRRPRDPLLPEATSGQHNRLVTSQQRAQEAVRRVQELDPTWRPTPSISEGVEGRIAENIARAREAEAKLGELLPRGFGSYESYAQFGNNLRQGFAGAGYNDTIPMMRGSSVTGESFRSGRPFDSNPGRPSDFDLAISSPSALRRAEELGIGLREGGSRTGPLRSEQLEALGLAGIHRELQAQAGGRDVSIMIYSSPTAITRRGPSRPFPGK